MPTDRPGQIGPYWLSKRPNSSQWCRTWFADRQTRRESLGTAEFQEAYDRLAEWYVANRAARNEPVASVGLEQLMARHYALHAKGLASAKAIETSYGYWTEYFAGATLADITPSRLADFVAVLFDMELSSGYVRRILADGKAAINGAFKRQEIATVPFIDMSLAPEGEPRERILSPDEMAALYDAISADHVRNYMILALGTMGRPDAITDLTTWSVDWKSGTINLLPQGRKQNKKRRPTVPMVPTVRSLVARLPGGPLIAYHGRKVESVRTTFRKAVTDAGLDGTGVCRYSVRHTIISEAMKRCSEPWQVEAFAGHRTGNKTTARYVKFSPGYLSKAAEAVEEYFADLEAMLGRSLLDHISTGTAFELRASLARNLVEPRGIEPLTSTLPVSRNPRKTKG